MRLSGPQHGEGVGVRGGRRPGPPDWEWWADPGLGQRADLDPRCLRCELAVPGCTNTYQVTVSGTAKTYTYDPNGNLTGDGTKTYEWDAENRLTAVKQGSTTLASFAYDGNGRRSSKTAGGVTTSYVHDGLQFLEERPSAGSTRRYVYGPGIDQALAQVIAGVTTYNVADHLGSIVRTTDSLGSPTFTREYDPWGNPIQGSSTSGFAYTGREWDAETSLYYYRARYYAPSVGRFVSRDPIGLLGGLNEYVYSENAAINRTDPLGLMSVGECLANAQLKLDACRMATFRLWNLAKELCRQQCENRPILLRIIDPFCWDRCIAPWVRDIKAREAQCEETFRLDQLQCWEAPPPQNVLPPPTCPA